MKLCISTALCLALALAVPSASRADDFVKMRSVTIKPDLAYRPKPSKTFGPYLPPKNAGIRQVVGTLNNDREDVAEAVEDAPNRFNHMLAKRRQAVNRQVYDPNNDSTISAPLRQSKFRRALAKRIQSGSPDYNN